MVGPIMFCKSQMSEYFLPLKLILLTLLRGAENNIAETPLRIFCVSVCCQPLECGEAAMCSTGATIWLQKTEKWDLLTFYIAVKIYGCTPVPWPNYQASVI